MAFIRHISEGAPELDCIGRKISAGRLGEIELYLSWVWNHRRHLLAVGTTRFSHRAWVKDASWFRRNAWLV